MKNSVTNPRGFIAIIHVQIANMDFDEIHVDLKKIHVDIPEIPVDS